MTVKELEGLLKNTLKGYVVDYNRINPKNKIDFSVTFTIHDFKATDIEGYDPKDEKFAEVKKLHGTTLYYMRIAKIIAGSDEKRVIFTTYRPEKQFKKEAAQRMMYTEAIRQLMVGGLEYSEAIYRMNQAEENQKENQTEPQAKPKGAPV